MTNQHILSQYDNDLNQLFARLAKMTRKVEERFAIAIKSLDKSNDLMAEKSLKKENKINQLETEINELCFSVIALYQPVASDLRIPISIIKISSDLERISDEAEKLAQATLVESVEKDPAKKPLIKVAKHVHEALLKVIDALEKQDLEAANAIIHSDLAVQNRYEKALNKLFKLINEHEYGADQSLAYLWAIKSLERTCDHLINICESLIYMKTGEHITE